MSGDVVFEFEGSRYAVHVSDDGELDVYRITADGEVFVCWLCDAPEAMSDAALAAHVKMVEASR